VQQSGPARSDGGVIHWVDLHTGPLTWQIRDQAGLSSVTEVLHRAYTSAIAVFSDGAQHHLRRSRRRLTTPAALAGYATAPDARSAVRNGRGGLSESISKRS
jgi:hypothetical protein